MINIFFLIASQPVSEKSRWGYIIMNRKEFKGNELSPSWTFGDFWQEDEKGQEMGPALLIDKSPELTLETDFTDPQ